MGRWQQQSERNHKSWSSYDYLRSCRRTQCQPFYSHSVFEANWKGEKLDKLVPHELTRNQKIMILKCHFSYFIQQQWTIFWSDCDMWWKVDIIWQPTDNDQLCGWTKKKFQTTFHRQTCTKKKGHRHCLVVWCWSDLQLSESRQNQYTSEKSAQRVNEMHWKLQCQQPALVNRKGLIFLHNNAWPHITQPAFQKLNKSGYKVLPHLQLELDMEQQTGSK